MHGAGLGFMELVIIMIVLLGLGLGVYILVIRPRRYRICPICGERTLTENTVPEHCGHCGAPLDQD